MAGAGGPDRRGRRPGGRRQPGDRAPSADRGTVTDRDPSARVERPAAVLTRRRSKPCSRGCPIRSPETRSRRDSCRSRSTWHAGSPAGGESIEDLTQVAMIGLLNAVDRFDPSREVQFSTYAAATIVGELKRHFRDKGWALRVPRRLQELAVRVNRALPELTQTLGRSPTIPELAEQLGVGTDEIADAMDAVQAYSTSLARHAGRGRGAGAARFARRGRSIDRLARRVVVAGSRGGRALPRDRRVLYLRFFRGLTQVRSRRTSG